MRRAMLCSATLLSLLASSCCNTGTGSNALDVLYIGPFTVVTTVNSDGSVNVNHAGDPGLVGPKEVGVQLNVFEPMTVQNVVLSYWHAGNNAGSQSIERTINQAYTPGQGGIGLSHIFEIPGSAQLGICEGLYYAFAVGYQLEGGTGGLYVGQPRLILPTKRQVSPGVIEETLCVEPPGPGE